jgi:threonine synthase
MRWISSRGSAPAVPFIDALFAGTAPDGGLYMPERLDPLPPEKLEQVRAASGIVPIASLVGGHLLRDEISQADLDALISRCRWSR